MSSEELDSETFQPLLRKLVSSPGEFTAEDTRRSMEHLFAVRPLASDAQIGAFYTAVHALGLELRADVLAAAADVLRNRATIPPPRTASEGETSAVANIVGTGGDGKNVFNVSTAAGIVAAGAGLCVRKPDARSLKRVWVVCGDEGLDEISCAGPTHVWDVNLVTRTIRTHTIIPEDFGLPRHPLDHVRGGTSVENAATLERLLQGDTSGSRDLDAVGDFVCMNAAALLVLAGDAEDLCHGVALARESVKSGRAWTAFAHFRDWT
ncbi:nucleoside phosphorylase/phosphoribosyltransferase catalytic domain-containing protein, partial [Exidia glandulosa HHB12029]